MEYEIKARKQLSTDNYSTLFALEHNADPKCVELIQDYYPFEKTVVTRSFRHFGWGNILEGFKQAFFEGADYVLNIEDDCLLHETYFTYMNTALNLLKGNKFSVINASRRLVPNTSITGVQATNLFEAPACLMNGYFFNKYVRPYATYDYYTNRETIIHLVNKRNGDDKRSKYRAERKNLFQHIGWDGLVNRLIDTAFIEEGLRSYSPMCDRQIHIGFYGQNRIGKLPFKHPEFADRVEALRDTALNAAKMMQLDPNYKDYVDFASQLDAWSGELTLI